MRPIVGVVALFLEHDPPISTEGSAGTALPRQMVALAMATFIAEGACHVANEAIPIGLIALGAGGERRAVQTALQGAGLTEPAAHVEEELGCLVALLALGQRGADQALSQIAQLAAQRGREEVILGAVAVGAVGPVHIERAIHITQHAAGQVGAVHTVADAAWLTGPIAGKVVRRFVAFVAGCQGGTIQAPLLSAFRAQGGRSVDEVVAGFVALGARVKGTAVEAIVQRAELADDLRTGIIGLGEVLLGAIEAGVSVDAAIQALIDAG